MEGRETCDFCKAPLVEHHRHLLDITNRKIFCSCDECAITGVREKQYKQVPSRYLHIASFQMPDDLWDRFEIPVGIAFFFFSSAVNRMAAFYPSPFGPIESEHGLDAWPELAKMNPGLASMQPDVEGLLVRRAAGRNEYYLVPIDECYRLVGIMRTEWKGIGGGKQVHEKISKFFEELRSKSSKST